VTPAWKAFDGLAQTNSVNECWRTSSPVVGSWLSYKHVEQKRVIKYAISAPGASWLSLAPKDWTFEGSNDGLKWDVLDTRVSETSWTAAQKRFYTVENESYYTEYRIKVNGSNDNNNNVAINMLEMFDTVGIIRSLTGGVAFADAEGNKSLTDTGSGGWPTNNEYDKYIVGFPADKIQAGKALDDVFHWKGIYTWCQDTSIRELQYSNNACRTVRGRNGSRFFSYQYTTMLNGSYGFRPVFQYRE
jgi:hypothetical protein